MNDDMKQFLVGDILKYEDRVFKITRISGVVYGTVLYTPFSVTRRVYTLGLLLSYKLKGAIHLRSDKQMDIAIFKGTAYDVVRREFANVLKYSYTLNLHYLLILKVKVLLS